MNYLESSWNITDLRTYLSFLFLPVFLFFGPAMPILIGFYFFLMLIVVLHQNVIRVKLLGVVGVAIAVGLEMAYRYRANDDSLLVVTLTAVGFFGVFFASSISGFSHKGKSYYLAGNVLVLLLIVLDRLSEGSLWGVVYELSRGRTVGPGISDPNAFALFHIAMLFPLLKSKNVNRIERYVLIGVLLSIPLYSLSRTALLVVACLFLLGFPRSLKRQKFTLVFTWLILFVSIFSAVTLVNDMSGRNNYGEALSKKIQYAKYGLNTLRNEFTLFGVQNNRHLKIHQVNTNKKISYHNTYISILASSGIFGVLGLIAVYLTLFKWYKGIDFVAVMIILNGLFFTTGYLIGLGYPVLLGVINERNKTVRS